ncbi:MAG TPA: hypothetical protein VLC46_22425 [Thermoanaerobaculia bacterium]|jgi:hypothetical protein|nr:hypothetical protein [Thermoanaerobaculia bacterium]
MIRSRLLANLLAVLMVFAGAAAASASAVFVDNRATPGGNGSHQWPFTTIGQAVQAGAVIYVAESGTPYVESVTLRKGQMLIGSAFGLDAARVEFHADIGTDSVPAVQGPGPAIRGTIATSGDNVIAGCTVFADGMSGIFGSGAIGALTVRNVYIKSSRAGFAIYLLGQQGKVNISGGAIDAADRGSGIGLEGGYGDVVIDRVPISGEFNSALRIQGRNSGTVTFRRGSKLHVRDAFDDAIVIAGIERPAAVIFEDTIEVRGRRRGLVVNKVAKLVIGGASTLSTANAAALEVHDFGGELSFESVSAEGVAPGTLDDGIILDGVHGKVSITGLDGKPGTGGAIQHARGNGMRIVQSSNVRITGITLTGSGVNTPLRGVRCAGDFQVNSTAICHAALYLRHISDSAFENIVVDGGGAMGINANNIRDVTFGGLDVHGAGNETFESGVLLQEAGGTVTFSRSSFVDNAGSEMLIEQRFNSGRIVLDRCVLAATGRPEVAPHLLEVRTFGTSRINVELRSAELKDNLGSAIDAAAAEKSFLSVDTSDSSLQHFGHGVVTVASVQNGNAGLILRNNSVVALVSDRAWVDVTASDAATACIDLAANRFSSVPGTVIHLGASPHSSIRVIGAPSGDAPAIASMIGAANGGAIAVVDGAVAAVPTCP